MLDQPLVPLVLCGNYEAIRFVFATSQFWPFSPLLFAANPDLLPGDSDKVTGEKGQKQERQKRSDRFIISIKHPRLPAADPTPTRGARKGATPAAIARSFRAFPARL